jgi:mannose-6-phosphate isomerase-like protein (cupin superfamily)
MRRGDSEDAVGIGDCVVIPTGVAHKLWNTGSAPLVLTTGFAGGARCCAPAYSDDDTVMTGR